MKKRLALFFLLVLSVSAIAASKHALTVEDLFAMGRVGNPAVSADGKWVAYTVSVYDMETNQSSREIWLAAMDGSGVRQLTTDPAQNFSPAWNPTDPNELALISTRDGSTQIFLMQVNTAEIRQLTRISTGASGPVWSPDGKSIAFVSDVYPDLKTDAENAARDAEREASPVKARVIDHLLYRHWNAWKENKRSHVFVADAETGVFQDMTPGDFDSPPISLGGALDYAFSPNSKTLAFVRNTDPMVAVSTNNDVFTVPVNGGTPVRMTPNPALDTIERAYIEHVLRAEGGNKGAFGWARPWGAGGRGGCPAGRSCRRLGRPAGGHRHGVGPEHTPLMAPPAVGHRCGLRHLPAHHPGAGHDHVQVVAGLCAGLRPRGRGGPPGVPRQAALAACGPALSGPPAGVGGDGRGVVQAHAEGAGGGARRTRGQAQRGPGRRREGEGRGTPGAEPAGAAAAQGGGEKSPRRPLAGRGRHPPPGGRAG